MKSLAVFVSLKCLHDSNHIEEVSFACRLTDYLWKARLRCYKEISGSLTVSLSTCPIKVSQINVCSGLLGQMEMIGTYQCSPQYSCGLVSDVESGVNQVRGLKV